MNRLSLFLILAGVSAIPAHADTYGDAVPDEPVLPSRITTVPRASAATSKGTPAPAPGAAQAPATAAAAAAAEDEVPAVERERERERWQLVAGHLIRQDLAGWGKKSGWQVLWHLPHDWTVPTDTEFEGDFKDAAGAVIRTLADNGLVIRGQFYDGNRTLVVSGAGPVILDPQ